MMRGLPWPLQRGRCTSRRAIRMDASGSRGLTRKSKSITVSQLLHAMTSQRYFEISAATILWQNRKKTLAEKRALKGRAVTDAARCASHSRRMGDVVADLACAFRAL